MVFNTNNAATVKSVFGRFINAIKREIEAWSQRGSGWVVEAVLEALTNAVQYQPC